MKEYYVYIIANTHNTVLYIGVTGDLERRMYEHKHKLLDGFSKKYNLHKLVYCESAGDVEAAIMREKQLKGWLRAKKNMLIEEKNKEWKDLSANWFLPAGGGSGDPSLRSG